MLLRGTLRIALALTVAPLIAPRFAPLQESAARHATGFFHAEQREGRWWLIDPAGRPFLSKGVASVQFEQDGAGDSRGSAYGEAARAKYGTIGKWRDAVARRLVGFGFNTLGAWSDAEVAAIDVEGKHLACAPVADFIAKYVLEQSHVRAWQKGIFPDVFDPAFEAFAQTLAKERCGPLKDNRNILGWFTDNELRWGPDWRGRDELLPLFLGLPATAPGRAVALRVLRERYGDVLRFDAIWQRSFVSWEQLESAGPIPAPRFVKRTYRRDEEPGSMSSSTEPRWVAYNADCDAFLAELAERYFQVTADALQKADPNHMDLGCRFAYVPAAPVIAAAARHVSVISFNAYTKDPRWSIGKYAPFGKPLLIGEFSFRARDSGLPNTKGSGPLLQNQVDRAAAFSQYVKLALSDPSVVGYHWFEHADEPMEGRFDGENSNNGLVDSHDDVYEVLARRMTKVNAEAEAIHAR